MIIMKLITIIHLLRTLALAPFEWHYLSHATCPMPPRLFYASFIVVSGSTIMCYILRHF